MGLMAANTARELAVCLLIALPVVVYLHVHTTDLMLAGIRNVIPKRFVIALALVYVYAICLDCSSISIEYIDALIITVAAVMLPLPVKAISIHMLDSNPDVRLHLQGTKKRLSEIK